MAYTNRQVHNFAKFARSMVALQRATPQSELVIAEFVRRIEGERPGTMPLRAVDYALELLRMSAPTPEEQFTERQLRWGAKVAAEAIVALSDKIKADTRAARTAPAKPKRMVTVPRAVYDTLRRKAGRK